MSISEIRGYFCVMLKARYALFIPFLFLLGGCGLFGIHFKVHNPKTAGVYPPETKQILLLGGKSKNRACYDVTHYGLDISIDPKKRYLKGTVVIDAAVLAACDTMQVDLYKNLKVNSITCGGENLPYKRVEGAILIKTPAAFAPGKKISVVIAYEGKPLVARRPPWAGGAVWKKDKQGHAWDGVACESEGGSIWWPCKDDVSDEADSTDISLTIPAGSIMAVSNGLIKDSTVTPASKTYRWHVSYPINTYNITYYVGDFKLIKDTYYSEITQDTLRISYYVLSKKYDVAKAHFQQLKKHLAFYEQKFGPYPWPRDGFKFIESPYAGMEHQTAIAYGNGYKNGYEGFDYIVLHETAHEWWGNSVTAADLADAWLQEGFATYAEVLYVESIKGHDASIDYLYNLRITIGNKRPVVRKRGVRYFSYKDEDIYSKGAWVLHSLRHVMHNDSLFFDIIKQFRIENHQKQVLTDAFTNYVNKRTGQDYNWFFKQYLYRRQAPVLEYYWAGSYLYYRWKNTELDFVKLPVEITCGDFKKIVYPTLFSQRIELPPDGKRFYFNNEYEVYYGTKNNYNAVSSYRVP